MTTIVYRNGVMVGDTRAYSGSAAPIGVKDKIFEIGGYLVGVSTSHVGLAERIHAWFSHGRKEPLADFLPSHLNVESLQVLAVAPDGAAIYIAETLLPIAVTDEYYAIGSGDKQALGALAMGATAREAVVAAAKYDMYTNAITTSLTHGGSK